MYLRDIFTKPIDRYIEGVIKADDMASLKLEIEEYVITSEIARRLAEFFDAYNDYQGANGVWISGFFGSGKSHLLKMLALLLENKVIEGKEMLEYFTPKCGDDAMLVGQMQKAISIPSQSILFNIDQKADTISTSDEDAVLSVFVKVFNELCGYYGKQGYVAQFERDLDSRGLLAQFKEAYQRASGMSWEVGREQVILEKENIAQAYAAVSGASEEASLGIMDKYRSDYRVSIENFAELVNNYIESRGPNFRLNFFVDEVGQFIADNVNRMTNLQTIAESLNTICRGRAWLVVTAQEDMDKVLGEIGQAEWMDFSKIMDRFRTRMKLTSKNVDEVIQRRLLEKNARGKSYLSGLYQREKNNFGTLFDFPDRTRRYRGFQDEDDFINSYPFIPYQFALFQTSIKSLSQHDAFEGRHRSVGERSMLGVFQDVVVDISDDSVGRLATFDLMFEGIRNTLKGHIQSSIITAEKNLEDEFAVRVLKALFLVKYVKEFKATPRNLRVLMQKRFDQDLNELRDKIEEALNLLEQQTYIQRSGEEYEYLTDEEKDIEQEIKIQEIDGSEVANTLQEILFSEVVKDRKIRYDGTGQDFSFTKKLDNRLYGREHELTIHFISPFHEHHEDLTILQANGMGKPELMIVLPSDNRFARDLLLYKRTEKYLRLNQASAQQESIRKILSDKAFQNRERFNTIKTRSRELVSKARMFASGDEIEIPSEEPRTRILQGFEELIVRIYPNLRMLGGITYRENDIGRYLESTQGTLFGTEGAVYSEAEQEMLNYIQSNKRNGVRTTMKLLVEYFSRKPYGWYQAAIQCILAKLLGRGSVEARADGNLLEDERLERALKNTHGFANLVLVPQIEFTPSQIRNLKDFYNDFFDRPPAANEAKALGKETRDAFNHLLGELEALADQADIYPFLSALDMPIQTIAELGEKPYSYFLIDLESFSGDLLDMKEGILDPIRQFMSGANKDIYRQARSFLNQQEANFASLDDLREDELRAILDDANCFKGDSMRRAKALMDELEAAIRKLVTDERDKANQESFDMQEQLRGTDDYQNLTVEQQEEIDRSFEQFRSEVESLKLVAVIRDELRRFRDIKYTELLNEMAQWRHEDGEGTGGVKEPPVEYISKRDLHVDFPKAYLADESDVEAYVEMLKNVLVEEIRKGKRIQI